MQYVIKFRSMKCAFPFSKVKLSLSELESITTTQGLSRPNFDIYRHNSYLTERSNVIAYRCRSLRPCE